MYMVRVMMLPAAKPIALDVMMTPAVIMMSVYYDVLMKCKRVEQL